MDTSVAHPPVITPEQMPLPDGFEITLVESHSDGSFFIRAEDAAGLIIERAATSGSVSVKLSVRGESSGVVTIVKEVHGIVVDRGPREVFISFGGRNDTGVSALRTAARAIQIALDYATMLAERFPTA